MSRKVFLVFCSIVLGGFVLVGFSYKERLVLRLLEKMSIVAPDSAVKIIPYKNGRATQLFAFAPRYDDVVIDLKVMTKNCTYNPPGPVCRGPSINMNDPLVTINPIDSSAVRYRYKFRYWPTPTPGIPDPRFVYLLPFQSGIKHAITGGSNVQSHKQFPESAYAVDFEMPEGSVVCAARDGVVAAYRSDSWIRGTSLEFRPYANFLLIRHDDGTYADYLHLSRDGLLVRIGDKVKAGQPIALSGNTGWSPGPHLHLAVFSVDEQGDKNGVPIAFYTADGIKKNLQRGDVVEQPQSLPDEHLGQKDQAINSQKD